MDEEEYVVTPIIPVDDLIHTDEYPFCDDPTCPDVRRFDAC